VTLVKLDVSEEHIAPFVMVIKIREERTLASKQQPTHAAKKYGLCVLRLLVTANVPRSPIFVILMMEELSSFETSVPTRVTRRNISEDGILHSHHVKTSNLIMKMFYVRAFTFALADDFPPCSYYTGPNCLHRGGT
jgi:hypothetical protein